MTKSANITRQSPEVASLRIELIKRGLSVRQLASMCGVSRMGLTSELSRGEPSAPMRSRIERSLGKVFWSSQAEFDRRSSIFSRLGVDFGFASLRELLAAAQRAGIDLTGARKLRSAAICRIEEFLAAHPNFNPTPSPQPRP